MKIGNSAFLSGPLGLVEGGGGFRRARFPVRYGLIEANGRRILVDTGYGPRILQGKRSAALCAYAAVLRPTLLPFDPGPIDTIFLTHLHADHVARVHEFPGAALLASQEALAQLSALSPRQATHHGIFTELLPSGFLERTAPVEVLPRISTGTILGEGYDLCGDGTHLAIPLPGHARGHFGVFWRENGKPLLYATDIAWTLHALQSDATPRIAQRLVFDDIEAAEVTRRKVRRFMAEGGEVILCHDPE